MSAWYTWLFVLAVLDNVSLGMLVLVFPRYFQFKGLRNPNRPPMRRSDQIAGATFWFALTAFGVFRALTSAPDPEELGVEVVIIGIYVCLVTPWLIVGWIRFALRSMRQSRIGRPIDHTSITSS